MKKEWKDIKGYEGVYQISNFGEIMSLRNNKLLKLEVLKKGYLRVGLNYKGVRKRFLVHRLVLTTFLEYRSYPEYECNHKDMNTQNNRIDNLEWVTLQENINHAIKNNPQRTITARKNGKILAKKYGHIGTEASKKPVARCDVKTGEILQVYTSAREASKEGYSYKNISQVCHNEKKTHKGFSWKFIPKCEVEITD